MRERVVLGCMDCLTPVGEIGEDFGLGMMLRESEIDDAAPREWKVSSSPTTIGGNRCVSTGFGRGRLAE